MLKNKTSKEEKTEVKVEKKKSGFKKVKPLKDFRIKFNQYDIVLKKGEEIEVPEIFLANLKTEKVI